MRGGRSLDPAAPRCVATRARRSCRHDTHLVRGLVHLERDRRSRTAPLPSRQLVGGDADPRGRARHQQTSGGSGTGEAVSTIVVGVDGSDEARAAVGWALEEARLRGASLRCVHVWGLPSLGMGIGYEPLLDATFLETLRHNAETVIDRTIAEVGGADGIDVERVAAEGMPAQVLFDAAKGATLLVVGSRGRGGFKGLLLGSVSQQCAQHATCPVVIVRQPAVN